MKLAAVFSVLLASASAVRFPGRRGHGGGGNGGGGGGGDGGGGHYPDTKTFNWELGWKWIEHNGVARPTIVVNGQWPPPTIDVDVDDLVVVNVFNNLGNETTSIHFHGMYQQASTDMDGPPMVTQCPIPPGSNFQYNFKVLGQVGTYWWHSHSSGQMADGLRGPMIIRDPASPFAHKVDGGEIVLTLSDWYNTQAPYLLNYYQSGENVVGNNGAEPIPDTGMINDCNDGIQIKVDKPGKTYLLRVANIGSFVGAWLEIEDHEFVIVEADGIYTEEKTVSLLYLTIAQRYGVLVKMKDGADAKKNYLIKYRLDTGMFDDVPDGYNPNHYGYLVYDAAASMPNTSPISDGDPTPEFDDITLVTSTANKWVDVDLYKDVTHRIILETNFTVIGNQTRATIQGSTYVPQKVPSLYTAMSTGNLANNPEVYSMHTNPIIIRQGEVVEMIINNYDTGNHPWHMHGRTYQLAYRSPTGGNYFSEGDSLPELPARPVRRDTAFVNAQGFIVLRFKSDTPGVRLLHCHIEWHVEAGLVATLVEEPQALQGMHIPPDHLDACKRQHIPTWGNAAGNQNALNLTGENTTPNPSPGGAVVDPGSLGPTKKRGFWPKRTRHRLIRD